MVLEIQNPFSNWWSVKPTKSVEQGGGVREAGAVTTRTPYQNPEGIGGGGSLENQVHIRNQYHQNYGLDKQDNYVAKTISYNA